MCAKGGSRPPHRPAVSRDSTESPRCSGGPSPALLPIPDSLSQLRSRLPLPQASPRALSAKRRQHGVNPSRDRGSFWDARRTQRPFPSARGLLPKPRGRVPRAAGRVQMGPPLLGGRGGLRAGLGTQRPGCVSLRVAAFVGDLGALPVLDMGWGLRILLYCEGPGPGQDQFWLLCGGLGRVVLTKSRTEGGQPPLPHLPGTATRGPGAGGDRTGRR